MVFLIIAIFTKLKQHSRLIWLTALYCKSNKKNKLYNVYNFEEFV